MMLPRSSHFALLSRCLKFLRTKENSYVWTEATASNKIRNLLFQRLVTISRKFGNRKLLEEDLIRASLLMINER